MAIDNFQSLGGGLLTKGVGAGGGIPPHAHSGVGRGGGGGGCLGAL